METEKILMIDTSVLIDYFRKKNKSKTLFYKLSLQYTLCASAITEFEFLVGVKENHIEVIKEIFNNLFILSFDSDCAKIAKNIYSTLQQKNKLLDFADVLIAATAIQNKLSFVTLNIDHFERIEHLELLKVT